MLARSKGVTPWAYAALAVLVAALKYKELEARRRKERATKDSCFEKVAAQLARTRATQKSDDATHAQQTAQTAAAAADNASAASAMHAQQAQRAAKASDDAALHAQHATQLAARVDVAQSAQQAADARMQSALAAHTLSDARAAHNSAAQQLAGNAATLARFEAQLATSVQQLSALDAAVTLAVGAQTLAQQLVVGVAADLQHAHSSLAATRNALNELQRTQHELAKRIDNIDNQIASKTEEISRLHTQQSMTNNAAFSSF